MNNETNHLEIKHWLVARFSLTREQAHQQLGSPHYIETDRFVEQRGLEDHWIMRTAEMDTIHLVFRARIKSLDVFAERPSLELIRSELNSLFSSFEPEVIQPPVLYPAV